jgi:hypothetical protein
MAMDKWPGAIELVVSFVDAISYVVELDVGVAGATLSVLVEKSSLNTVTALAARLENASTAPMPMAKPARDD